MIILFMTAGFVALDAVLYNNTVYVSLRCRVCGAWCGTVQSYCLCFSLLQGLWRLVWYCTIGWVNLYQKFEIEKYTVCGKLILPQKWKSIFFFFGTTGLRICMDLRIFASFLYPILLKICSQKFDRK